MRWAKKRHPRLPWVHAVAGFAGDFTGVRRFAERDHKNIVRWTMYPEPGGHYAAHTEPSVLAGDIRAFYGSLT